MLYTLVLILELYGRISHARVPRPAGLRYHFDAPPLCRHEGIYGRKRGGQKTLRPRTRKPCTHSSENNPSAPGRSQESRSICSPMVATIECWRYGGVAGERPRR